MFSCLSKAESRKRKQEDTRGPDKKRTRTSHEDGYLHDLIGACYYKKTANGSLYSYGALSDCKDVWECMTRSGDDESTRLWIALFGSVDYSLYWRIRNRMNRLGVDDDMSSERVAPFLGTKSHCFLVFQLFVFFSSRPLESSRNQPTLLGLIHSIECPR